MAAEGRRKGGDRNGGGRGRGDYDQEPMPPGGYRDDRDRSPAVRGEPPYEDRYREPPYRKPPGPHPRDDPYIGGDPYRHGPLPPPIDDPYREPFRDDPYRRDPYRRDPYDDPYRDPYRDPFRDPYLPPLPPPPPKKPAYPADVQIVCMTKTLMLYAENIESRLRGNAMITDIVVIPEDLTVPQMVEDAARLKFLFAIILNSQNEVHKSLTLNILHGTPQEHRNMPLEDAIKLIGTSFEKYIQTQREKAAPTATAVKPASTATMTFVPPAADIAYLLNLLADNRQLTVEEIDKVLVYLKERKDKLMLAKGILPTESPSKPAPAVPIATSVTTTLLQQQQQELQNKILNILNGSESKPQLSQPAMLQAQSQIANVGSLLSTVSSIQPPPPVQQPVVAAAAAASPIINFDNPNVQKALDNLIQSGPNLLKSIPSSVSQQAPARQSNYLSSAPQPVPRPEQQAQRPPAQPHQQGAVQGVGVTYGQYPQRYPQPPAGRGYANPQQRPPYMGARTPQQGVRPRY